MPKSRKPRRKASRKTSRKGKKCPPGCVKKILKRSRKSLKSSRRRVSRKASRKRKSVKRKASRKRRSVKRKASRKRKSVKRKASRKRKSVKRKASRKRKSVKRKASRKRRSVKRKASRKRRSVKRKASRKRRSVKRKASRKRKSVKRKASRKRKSAKRKASRKRKSAKRKSRKHHKGKFRISSWWNPLKNKYSVKKFIPWTDAGRARQFRHDVKAQQHIEGQQYRDGLIQVIKRIKPGMPSSTYLEVAKLFIKYGYGFTPKIPLSPKVLIRRGNIKRDYKKADYMKANNRRIKAAWDYYFTHKRDLHNKQEGSIRMNQKQFIEHHTSELQDQKKKARCLKLQGIVSQTQNESIKAHGVKEMQELGCSRIRSEQFQKQLVRVGRQTSLRSAAKQLKANPKKMQQMREQFQKYNKICARYGGYYGIQKIPPHNAPTPVCKAGGKVKDPRFGSIVGSDGKLTTITYPKMPVAVAEKLLQKGTAGFTKLQARARGRKVRTGESPEVVARRQRQIQEWKNTPILAKRDQCRKFVENLSAGGDIGVEARRHYKTHDCKGVKNRITQALKKAKEAGKNEEQTRAILAEMK